VAVERPVPVRVFVDGDPVGAFEVVGRRRWDGRAA
jgi:hypothetical protein